MNQIDYDVLASIYTRLQSQTLPARQVGYEDSMQQLLYFEILAAIGFPSTATILDVGCGCGDLYAYLLAQGYKGHYIGLDIMPHLIEQAKQRFTLADFLVGDIVSTDLPCDYADYALASGPFDYRSPNSQERWQQAIARMFSAARCGIAWNGITAVPQGRNDLWAQPLSDVLELCPNFSPYYAIRCDYDPLHFTAYIYKREHFYTDNLQALIGYLYLHPEYTQELGNDPRHCAAQFGVNLQQLNAIAPLWMHTASNNGTLTETCQYGSVSGLGCHAQRNPAA